MATDALAAPSRIDVTDPASLERLVRSIVSTLNANSASLVTLSGKTVTIDATALRSIHDALMSTGSIPLNVTGLLGILAQPQVPGLVITASITALEPGAYPANTMAVATGSPADTLYYNKIVNQAHVWVALHAAGPTNMLTTDTAQSVTGTKTWTAGQINTQSQFCSRAYASGVQAIANATETAIAFNTNDSDVGGVHSTSTNNTRFTVPVGGAGRWLLLGVVDFALNTTGSRKIKIVKNGAADITYRTESAVQDNDTVLEVSYLDLAAVDGDYYEFFCAQSSGGSLNTRGGSNGCQGNAYKLG